MTESGRVVIGFIEQVTVFGRDYLKKKLMARIDSGAVQSSIDARLAAELHLGPIVKRSLVTSANGRTVRPVMAAEVILADQQLTGEFTLADRGHMKYKVLI